MNYTLEQLNEMMERNCGYLDLRGTAITSLPEGLTVGGYLYLEGCTCASEIRKITRKFEQGEYVSRRYVYADGILTHVKRKRKLGEYTYFVGKIPGKNVIYDGENYAHCKTFSDGVKDLEFKKAKDRGADQYKILTLDSVVQKDAAITMYRVITGACRAGTEQFLSTIKEFKAEYTVREIVELTRGHYGATVFADFFNRE